MPENQGYKTMLGCIQEIERANNDPALLASIARLKRSAWDLQQALIPLLECKVMEVNPGVTKGAVDRLLGVTKEQEPIETKTMAQAVTPKGSSGLSVP